jgi:hypothetical protein
MAQVGCGGSTGYSWLKWVMVGHWAVMAQESYAGQLGSDNSSGLWWVIWVVMAQVGYVRSTG